mmetsp:Transcript_28397/g.25124  ORF Transcript_28397/g.25124 Transcript_28397/m.25124 type:complete len:150 (-) Transcript_28397:33-482(-)
MHSSTENKRNNGSQKGRRQIGGSFSTKYNKAKHLAGLNKSNEYVRPQQLINTQNNIIIISNHGHTKSSKGKKKSIVNKNFPQVGNLLENFGSKNTKKKVKRGTLVNAPYLKLPGSNSFVDNTFKYNSSRRDMKSDQKRKSDVFNRSLFK